MSDFLYIYIHTKFSPEHTQKDQLHFTNTKVGMKSCDSPDHVEEWISSVITSAMPFILFQIIGILGKAPSGQLSVQRVTFLWNPEKFHVLMFCVPTRWRFFFFFPLYCWMDSILFRQVAAQKKTKWRTWSQLQICAWSLMILFPATNKTE